MSVNFIFRASCSYRHELCYPDILFMKYFMLIFAQTVNFTVDIPTEYVH